MKKINNCYIIFVLLLTLLVGCSSSGSPKVYLSVMAADGDENKVVLDQSGYNHSQYPEEAPDPEDKTIKITFMGEEYEADYARAQVASYGNFFYEYKSDDKKTFTVNNRGEVVGFQDSGVQLDETKVTAFSAEEIAEIAADYFEKAFGEEIAGMYEAELSDPAPAYVTVKFHLADKYRDERFTYVDSVSVQVMPDGSLLGILGRSMGRFINKSVPEYFTDEYIDNLIKETINDDSVSYQIIPGEKRLLTVNNGTLACKIGIKAEKDGASQSAEILIELE